MIAVTGLGILCGSTSNRHGHDEGRAARKRDSITGWPERALEVLSQSDRGRRQETLHIERDSKGNQRLVATNYPSGRHSADIDGRMDGLYLSAHANGVVNSFCYRDSARPASSRIL